MKRNVSLLVGLLAAASVPAAYAWDCDTNCYDELRICKKVFGKKLCTPPEPTSLAACTTVKNHSCAVRDAKNFFNNASAAAWGAAGAVGYPATAADMAARHLAWQNLMPEQIQFLSKYHSVETLAQIRVHYYATLADAIGQQPLVIRRSQSGSSGQTFGYDIYIVGPDRGMDCTHLALLNHEIVHTVQAISRGGLAGFGYDYFFQYKAAGMNYEGNPMEREAEAFSASARAACQ